MFLEFQKFFNQNIVFSIKDIEKAFPGFNKMNLVRWQKKNLIVKIRNGWYRFNNKINSEAEYFYIANKIYSPSYISFESALNHYGMIPESVFTISSVSTLKTQKFKTPAGNYNYCNLKPDLFFGYSVNTSGIAYKIAEPEKALLDFLYLQYKIKYKSDIESFRLNKTIVSEKVNYDKVLQYAHHFNSKELLKKTQLLLMYLND